MFGVFYPGQSYPAQAPSQDAIPSVLDLCETSAESLMPLRTSSSLLPVRRAASRMPARSTAPYCAHED